MSKKRTELLQTVIQELQNETIAWDINKVKSIIGGRYTKKYPELFHDFLFLLQNKYITVSYESIALQKENIDNEMEECISYVSCDLTEYGKHLYRTICSWLIGYGAKIKHIKFTRGDYDIYASDISMGCKIENTDAHNLLHSIFPYYQQFLYITNIDRHTVNLFLFTTTPEYQEWNRKKEEAFSKEWAEFHDKFLDSMKKDKLEYFKNTQ